MIGTGIVPVIVNVHATEIGTTTVVTVVAVTETDTAGAMTIIHQGKGIMTETSTMIREANGGTEQAVLPVSTWVC